MVLVDVEQEQPGDEILLAGVMRRLLSGPGVRLAWNQESGFVLVFHGELGLSEVQAKALRRVTAPVLTPVDA